MSSTRRSSTPGCAERSRSRNGSRRSKWAILRWLEGIDGEEIYGWIAEKRPDLKLGDRPTTVSRIDQDLTEVRKLVEAL
jgi:hypothetical protein